MKFLSGSTIFSIVIAAIMPFGVAYGWMPLWVPVAYLGIMACASLVFADLLSALVNEQRELLMELRRWGARK